MTWTAREAESFLNDLIRLGIKYGLENFSRLLGELEHPERRARWVHVAGTNGKGSTSAMTEAILRAHGQPTLLFTSPHLVSLRERFRLDGEPAGEAAFAAALGRIARATRRLEDAGHEIPTFFEGCAAAAFEMAGQREGCFGVAEAGLGGRLDATNLLVPEACAITSIGLDHTKTLGPTREHIAAEKAGIAKPGVPLFVSDLGPGPHDVVAAKAAEVGAPLHVVRPRLKVKGIDGATRRMRLDLEVDDLALPDLELSLLGRHQGQNAAMALVLARATLDRAGVGFDPEAARAALAGVRWPGRFDVRAGDPVLVLDAVHNAEGMRAFDEAWQACFGDQKATVLFGACGDKALKGMYAPLSRIARSITFTRAEVRRAAPADLLAERWRDEGYGFVPHRVDEDVAAAYRTSHTIARNEGSPLVVCGSLYLLGNVLALPEGPGLDG